MFLREQIKPKDKPINSLLEHGSRHDDIYLSKKGSLLPENAKQTNIEQKSDQEQITSSPPPLVPKNNLNKSDVINIDKNEILPIPNYTTF